MYNRRQPTSREYYEKQLKLIQTHTSSVFYKFIVNLSNRTIIRHAYDYGSEDLSSIYPTEFFYTQLHEVLKQNQKNGNVIFNPNSIYNIISIGYHMMLEQKFDLQSFDYTFPCIDQSKQITGNISKIVQHLAVDKSQELPFIPFCMLTMNTSKITNKEIYSTLLDAFDELSKNAPDTELLNNEKYKKSNDMYKTKIVKMKYDSLLFIYAFFDDCESGSFMLENHATVSCLNFEDFHTIVINDDERFNVMNKSIVESQQNKSHTNCESVMSTVTVTDAVVVADAVAVTDADEKQKAIYKK
jgi:hypothetical protein